MINKKIKIVNPSGLHLRPAGVFCEKALEYRCHVTFRYRGDNIGNAKSVLSILGACVRQGDEIEVICDGSDEEEAMEGILRMAEDGFGEK